MQEFNSRLPIYIQMINRLKYQMVTGQIMPGEKLPSSRDLAVAHSINPNTASRVYREMELLGLCYTKRGLGTFITEDAKVIESIKVDMARECVQEYKTSMASLGFTKKQMTSIIQNEED